MNAADQAYWVAWAQIWATGFAGVGLFFTAGSTIFAALSARNDAKASAMDWLFRFEEMISASVAALASDAETEHHFRDHLNFLETSCTALENRLVPRAVKPIIVDAVVDHLATIQAAPKWRGIIESNVTHPNALAALLRFYEVHKDEIERLSKTRIA